MKKLILLSAIALLTFGSAAVNKEFVAARNAANKRFSQVLEKHKNDKAIKANYLAFVKYNKAFIAAQKAKDKKLIKENRKKRGVEDRKLRAYIKTKDPEFKKLAAKVAALKKK